MIGRTNLSEEQYATVLISVRTFLRAEPAVTNARLRALTGLNYDQAIKFFNLAVGRGVLLRRGRASSVHYVLADAIQP